MSCKNLCALVSLWQTKNIKMKVFVNNEPKEVEHQITINALLKDLNLSSAKGIAVAVNNQVVPKLTWENFSITENDKVTIIKATQGG